MRHLLRFLALSVCAGIVAAVTERARPLGSATTAPMARCQFQSHGLP